MTEQVSNEVVEQEEMNEDQYIGLVCMVAEVAHEANRGYCKHLGDESQLPWADCPDWQQTSIIQGVCFKIQHPESTPAESHQNWLQEKIKTGWIYGETKDVEHKMHPCMLPYSQLPEEQKAKDALFQSITETMCKQFGLIPRV